MSDPFVHMITAESIKKLKYNYTECSSTSTSTTKVTSLLIITQKQYNSIQEHINASNNKTK